MKAVCGEYLKGQFGGDESVVEEIYAEYARSAREKAEEASAALKDERYDDLDRIAHAAKGKTQSRQLSSSYDNIIPQSTHYDQLPNP